jgi:exosortase
MSWLLLLLPLGYLWFCLINNLRVEWATNPQYSFGWVIPLLCLGLLLRRWQAMRDHKTTGPQDNGPVVSGPVVSGPVVSGPVVRWSRDPVILLLSLLAFLYLPTHLIEAAVPEWRPIQWSLGVLTIGLTLGAIHLARGRGWLAQLAFPICFFLVAIPWPSLIETPIIQSLTRANAAMVVELMGWLGEPAMQHGNVIEVSTGAVGIDEACSGIRSFQSSLMISLFLGEFYRLTILRRLLLVPAGFLMAFGFNVCRTGLLTWVAAKRGIAAIAQYHDPAGIAILLACTAGMWAVALLLLRTQKSQLATPSSVLPAAPLSSVEGPVAPLSRGPVAPAPPPSGLRSPISPLPPPPSALPRFAFALILWLVVCEVGVHLWYRSRESHLTPGPEWSLVFPTNSPAFESWPINAKTESFLRFDEGKQAQWKESDGTLWQAFYFSWSPGRVAGFLAKRHTPEICMPAAGLKLRSGPELMHLDVHGLQLTVRRYVFEAERGLVHVFHCRWEAGADREASVQQESGRFNQLRCVWTGRGNRGQKVFEFIVPGLSDAEQARQALRRQLEKLINVQTRPPAPRQ